MIVWINGAFGNGKTTLVKELRSRRPNAVVFDPEHIGYVLSKLVPVPTGDFQDLASWREIVAASVLSVDRHHADLLLVGMTLVRDAYRRQVMDTIRGAKTELSRCSSTCRPTSFAVESSSACCQMIASGTRQPERSVSRRSTSASLWSTA